MAGEATDLTPEEVVDNFVIIATYYKPSTANA